MKIVVVGDSSPSASAASASVNSRAVSVVDFLKAYDRFLPVTGFRHPSKPPV